VPSFDIVSEVDHGELVNALTQARKELATRFDFKNSPAEIDDASENVIKLAAVDGSKLAGLLEIVVGKLARRNIDLRNIDRKDPAISSMGRATQELHIKQGLDGDKAKEIIKAIKEADFKVQCSLQDRQIRVTGKKKDDLQAVIQFARSHDFGVSLAFKNFRE
jgi:cyclic-di-GMP-binding protein